MNPINIWYPMRCILISGILFILALAVGCSGGENNSVTVAGQSVEEGSGGASSGLSDSPESQKNYSQPNQQIAEGSGRKMVDHPNLEKGQKLERRVVVPESVKGKWKSVKILIKNKLDEGNSEIKTVKVGETFILGDSGLKVTVGPFLPNFVMNDNSYTSMNNQLINPAVQLVVEENGEISYKGWAFEKYPSMYAYEHEAYSLELVGYFPADVS